MNIKEAIKKSRGGKLILLGITAYIIASTAQDINQSNHVDFIHSFFSEASKESVSIDNYIYSDKDLSEFKNLNHNPSYYHDGNASVRDIEENFNINLDFCKMDIGLYHTYYPLTREDTEYSLETFINPIYVYNALFDCEVESKNKSFSAITFLRGSMYSLNDDSQKIYKVVFREM